WIRGRTTHLLVPRRASRNDDVLGCQAPDGVDPALHGSLVRGPVVLNARLVEHLVKYVGIAAEDWCNQRPELADRGLVGVGAGDVMKIDDGVEANLRGVVHRRFEGIIDVRGRCPWGIGREAHDLGVPAWRAWRLWCGGSRDVVLVGDLVKQ